MPRSLSLASVLLAFALLAACKEASSNSTPTTVNAGTTPTTVVEPVATLEPTATAGPNVIEVLGDATFKAWTERALDLLESKDPDIYAVVLEAIEFIEPVAAETGVFDVEGKHYAVGEENSYAPEFDEEAQLVWFAGSIVHNAHHSAQHSRGDPHTGKEAEVECLTVQLAAMQLLTDDASFPTYLQGLIDGADDPANQYWNQPNRHW